MADLSCDLAAELAAELDKPAPIAPIDTIESILGDMLVEYWDARYGTAIVEGVSGPEIDSWAGQVRGTLLSAPSAGQRPAFTADGSNFGGLPVVATAITGERVLQNLAISPPLMLATQVPYFALVARMRTDGGGIAVRFFLSNGAGGIATGYNSLITESGLLRYQYYDGAAAYLASGGAYDADVHWLECFGSNMDLAVDGLIVGSDPRSGALTEDMAMLGMGFIPVLNAQYGDVSAAVMIIANGRPTIEQRIALLTLMAETWGLPITPPTPTFVLAGGNPVTGAGGPIIGGGSS